MADSSKRNSTAGKVATPKTTGAPAAQAMPDTLESLGKAVGARLRLTTAAPQSQTYEGTLFSADPILNIIAINTSTSAGVDSGNYNIIPFSRIQSLQIVARPKDTDGSGNSFASAQPAIGPVDVKRLKQREEERINQLQEEEKNRGRGVTKEAQAIFDSFKRINMPIRWHNQEMVVHDAVIIAPPYRPEDCKGAKEKQEVLNRVKKVLEGERRKIKEREDRERKAATPTGPRKGG